MGEKEGINILPVVGGGDSEETIIGFLNNIGVEMDKEYLFKFIYQLALDKLVDKDKMFSIRSYFKL